MEQLRKIDSLFGRYSRGRVKREALNNFKIGRFRFNSNDMDLRLTTSRFYGYSKYTHSFTLSL
ncbi:hypothetical protein CQ012_06450 [Arthrobacter sp. MYb214]|nr:hypothetical protein CQ012_06450 [Arthrobacter sp. MYb214]